MIRRIIALSLVALSASPAAARCRAGQTVSWYGEPQLLSDGSRYDPDRQTCASRTAKRGTVLRVVDLDTGRSIDCLVNDHGPAAWTGCEVDLSRRSAEKLGILGRGTARARIEAIYPRRDAGPSRAEREDLTNADFSTRWRPFDNRDNKIGFEAKTEQKP